jgi:hypothetical protein
MKTKHAWPLLLVLAGCFGGREPSPYLRITTSSGRLYYAHTDRTLFSESGGFVSFRDLVTREEVQLKNGTYFAEECSLAEVDAQQQAFLDDPTSPPRREPK